jgi:hypothetical protein
LPALVQCLQRIHAVDSIIGLLIWSKRICISNEKSEPSSLGQFDDMQTGNKTNTAGLPQSPTQREYQLSLKHENLIEI